MTNGNGELKNGKWATVFKVVAGIYVLLIPLLVLFESWQTRLLIDLTADMAVVNKTRFTGEQGSQLDTRLSVLESRIPATFPPQQFMSDLRDFKVEIRNTLESVQKDVITIQRDVALINSNLEIHFDDMKQGG